MADKPTYELHFEALPDPVPAVLRLRRLLKYAIRAVGFRCTRHVELRASESDTSQRLKKGAERGSEPAPLTEG